MLKSKRQNYHHSKLPEPGEIGYLVDYKGRFNEKYYYGGKQKYQVIAYPLCDNVLPWSKGIHTAYFKSLKNGKIIKMSGFYFEAIA
jgi:hypothetical protein